MMGICFYMCDIKKQTQLGKFEMNTQKLNMARESYESPDVEVIATPCVDVITSSSPKDSNQGEWDQQ